MARDVTRAAGLANSPYEFFQLLKCLRASVSRACVRAVMRACVYVRAVGAISRGVTPPLLFVDSVPCLYVRPPPSLCVVEMMGVPEETIDQWNVFHPEWLEALDSTKPESTQAAQDTSDAVSTGDGVQLWQG